MNSKLATNDIVELDWMCLHMKRTEGQKSTRRVKYLVIMESTFATLVSQVLVEASDVML
jgi:hypothetical protein